MLNRKEISVIIISVIVLAFVLTLMNLNLKNYGIVALAILLVLLINVFAKKVMSYYVESEIEIKLWEVKRYGFRTSQYFKKAIPAGVIIPLLTTIISAGYITWISPLAFDVKAKIHRAAKRHGLYSFSEMTEYHIGVIAAAGIFANLVFAIIGYLIGFPTFSKLNIYFALWNMIPLSELDGNKIFFGSIILWTFLATLTLIALGYAIFLV